MASPSVAIITGAGRGIGRATAMALARRGFRLVLVSRTAADLEQTATMTGGEAVCVTGDVTDPQLPPRVIEQAISRFGRIDALVNNAGYAPVLSVEQLTAEQWRRIIDTNLTAAFQFIHYTWPVMRSQGSGVVVNISSAAARDPFPGLGAYGAAKAGLALLGLSLAREGSPHGIRVHTVAPSATETGMFRQIMTHEQVPSDQVLAPAEVAKIIVSCITGELQYTSGESIWVHKRA